QYPGVIQGSGPVAQAIPVGTVIMKLPQLFISSSQHYITTVVQGQGQRRFVVDPVIDLGIEIVKSVTRHVPFLLPVVDPDPFWKEKEIKQSGARTKAVRSATILKDRSRCIDFGGHDTDIHRPFEVFFIPVFGPYIQYRRETSPVGGRPVTFVE